MTIWDQFDKWSWMSGVAMDEQMLWRNGNKWHWTLFTWIPLPGNRDHGHRNTVLSCPVNKPHHFSNTHKQKSRVCPLETRKHLWSYTLRLFRILSRTNWGSKCYFTGESFPRVSLSFYLSWVKQICCAIPESYVVVSQVQGTSFLFLPASRSWVALT